MLIVIAQYKTSLSELVEDAHCTMHRSYGCATPQPCYRVNTRAFNNIKNWNDSRPHAMETPSHLRHGHVVVIHLTVHKIRGHNGTNSPFTGFIVYDNGPYNIVARDNLLT